MDLTFSITEILGIMTALVGFIGISFTILWNLYKFTQRNARDLADFKLQAARDFASVTHIRDVELKIVASEERLLAGINALTSRIDRMLTRLNNKDD